MDADFSLPSGETVDPARRLTLPFSQWVARIHRICVAAQESGPTAARPGKGCWVGRRYFDTTLGKPVYVKALNLSPPHVWVDGTGALS